MRRSILIVLVFGLAAAAAAQTTCTSHAQCEDGDPCTVDTCEANGRCSRVPLPEGTSCSDGNPCNGLEVCRNHRCRPGTNAPAGTACSTGNPCTTGDYCSNGVCRPGPARPDGARCGDTDDCNGRETCRAGVCVQGPPRPDGAPCGDGNPCNGDDRCVGQVCVPGPVRPEGWPCTDGNPCNGEERCQAGTCSGAGTPLPDGTLCPDANVCNGTEYCQRGACVPGRPLTCDDGNPCTSDSCDRTAGCRHTPRPAGAACDDGNPCNGRERCREGGTCGPGTPLADGTSCDDGNPCNGFEECRAAVCRAVVSVPDGFPCPDDSVCNGLERCEGGRCRPGTPLVCDDGNPCSADTCDPQRGCRFPLLPDGTPCGDDQNVCDGRDLCRAGVCAASPPPDCNDGNPATPDVCDPLVGCTEDAPAGGDRLTLSATPGGRLALGVRARIAFGPGGPAVGGEQDPVRHGGVLRLRSVAAGFDRRFPLPKGSWRYLGPASSARGVRFVARGRGAPVRRVIVRSDGGVRINGVSAELGPPLAADPSPVEVVLILGTRRHCMRFGGEVRFVAGESFRAAGAPAPAACPP